MKKRLLISSDDEVFRFKSDNFGNTEDHALRRQDHRKLNKRMDELVVANTMDFQINLATVEQKELFLDFLKRRRNKVVSINNLRHLKSFTGFIQDNSSVNRRACIRELNLTFVNLAQPVDLSQYDERLLEISDTYGFLNTRPSIQPDPEVDTWYNTQGEDAYGYDGAGLTGNPVNNPAIPEVDNSPYSETDGTGYWETDAVKDWITRFDSEAGLAFWLRDTSNGTVVGAINKERGPRFELNVIDGKFEVIVQDQAGGQIHVITDESFDFTDWVFVNFNFTNPSTVQLLVGEKGVSSLSERSLTTIRTEPLTTFKSFDVPVNICARSFTDHNRGFPYLNWQTFSHSRDNFLATDLWKPSFHPRALTLEEAYSLWQLS